MAPIQGGLAMLTPRWNPVKIDALGLVTLLGAEEVGRAVGSLQKRRFTEYLPLLGAFIVAGDRFTDQQLGFDIYNFTSRIHSATLLNGWFTRWLAAQDINRATTMFRWTYSDDCGQANESAVPAIVFSIALVAPLLPCAILTGDWWGVANWAAIVISILVRVTLLARLRNELNKEVTKPHLAEEMKIMISRPDGAIVTILAPGQMLIAFTRAFDCTSSSAYRAMGLAGWIAFAIHACVLGMCTLLSQIYTVVLLVGSTLLMVQRFHFDISATRRTASGWPATVSGTSIEGLKTTVTRPFGKRIVVGQFDSVHTGMRKDDRRANAIARLQLSDEEEEIARQWELLPPYSEQMRPWYSDYSNMKAEYASDKAAQPAA